MRAYQPWPGSFIETPRGRLIVSRASVCPGEPGDESGRIAAQGNGLALLTRSGRLVMDEVQLAGKRRLTGAEFRRGYPGLVGGQAGSAVR